VVDLLATINSSLCSLFLLSGQLTWLPMFPLLVQNWNLLVGPSLTYHCHRSLGIFFLASF
jgi:hypothetical protein